MTLGLLAATIAFSSPSGADTSASPAESRSKPSVIETIEGYCRLFNGDKVDVVAAAQRYGMHLVDDKQMSVTFTPRDRTFTTGAALRVWKTNDLGGINLDVEPTQKVPFSKLQDAFGPFRFVRRIHPGDDYEFVARWPRDAANVACQIVVTLGARTEHPTGHEPVVRLSIGR